MDSFTNYNIFYYHVIAILGHYNILINTCILELNKNSSTPIWLPSSSLLRYSGNKNRFLVSDAPLLWNDPLTEVSQIIFYLAAANLPAYVKPTSLSVWLLLLKFFPVAKKIQNCSGYIK